MSYIKGGNLEQIGRIYSHTFLSFNPVLMPLVKKYKPDLSILRLWFAELVLALEYVPENALSDFCQSMSNLFLFLSLTLSDTYTTSVSFIEMLNPPTA